MGPRSPDSPVFGDPHVQEMKAVISEERSGGDGGSACENSSSVATPSSVHLIGPALTRDLSDLSGSYMNGSPLPPSSSSGRGGGGGGSAAVPRNIFGSPRESPLTIRQPWRQAFSLSNPAPDAIGGGAKDPGPKMPILTTITSCAAGPDDDLIMIEQNGGVEVMSPGLVANNNTLPQKKMPMPLDLFESSAAVDASAPTTAAELSSHERFPIVIVLMNPCYKTYELMQLWLDGKTDTVRQVLHTLRQALPNTWSQDYDGLAQFRRNRMSQLINCLRIQQFEVVPYEIWVAKPWALSADKTARYTDNLLEHLKKVGVVTISSTACDSPKRGGGGETGERVLTLSPEARRRIHAPDGILTHHHAIQYLSFCPPFEKPFDKPPVFPKFTETVTAAATPASNRLALAPSTSAAANTTNNTVPSTRAASPTNSASSSNFDTLGGSIGSSCYPEICIESGGLLRARALSPLSTRAISPDHSSVKSSSSLHFSTDSSTEESQVLWDDGTIRVSSNLGDRRFSLQSLASQYELSFHRRRSSSSKARSGNSSSNVRRLKTLFSQLSCKQRKEEAVASERHKNAANLSFVHDDTLSLGVGGGQHLRTLFEVDSVEERSMADMPLLNSSRDKMAFENDIFDEEYAA